MPVPGLGDVNPSEFPEQANEIWKMLDDMAARDPREYKEFIAKQMREAQEMAEAKKRRGTGSRTFTPSPGLVIKVRAERGPGNGTSPLKLFLNLCGHRAVQAPTLPSGAVVIDATTSAEHPDAHRMASSLSVPLAVGHLRTIEASGGAEGQVADVVFHPWVVQKATSDNMFLCDLMALAVSCACSEHGLKALDNPRHLRATYKGGTTSGDGSVTPVPFDVDAAESRHPSDSGGGERHANEGHDQRTPPGDSEPTVLKSPSHLLRAVQTSEEEEVVRPRDPVTPASSERCRCMMAALDRTLEVSISLPGYTSMESLALDVTRTGLQLTDTAEARTLVDEQFPASLLREAGGSEVDAPSATAKFSKKRGMLRVFVPLR